MCFLALSIDEEGLSSGDNKPRDPYNAARPRVNWIFFKGPIREFCLREVGAMSGDFAEEVGWRSGLGAGSCEVESETKKNEAGSRRRRNRGAGGRLRCVCWPQCRSARSVVMRHFKGAHLTSPQTVQQAKK